MPKSIKLTISIILPQLAGFLGSFFTTSSIQDWYFYLEKPAFSPPNWLFGPAWITLYLLMGISIYLIWHAKGTKKWFWLFWLHLAFNAAWTPIFFGLHNIVLAFICIIIIWLFIITLIIGFYKTNKLAAWLLVPYLLWVSFASLLNFSLWQLNSII